MHLQEVRVTRGGGEGDSPIFVNQRFASVPAKIGTVPRTH